MNKNCCLKLFQQKDDYCGHSICTFYQLRAMSIPRSCRFLHRPYCFMASNLCMYTYIHVPGLFHGPDCFTVSTFCPGTDLGSQGYFGIKRRSCIWNFMVFINSMHRCWQWAGEWLLKMTPCQYLAQSLWTMPDGSAVDTQSAQIHRSSTGPPMVENWVAQIISCLPGLFWLLDL